MILLVRETLEQLRVAFHLILQPILDQYLTFVWECRVSASQLKQARLPVKVYFEHYWHLVLCQVLEGEVESTVEFLARARVSDQVDLRVRQVKVKVPFLHFEAPVENGLPFQFVLLPVLVGEVDDIAECCCKSSVVLDFGFIFFSTCPVQVRVNERLHRVNVQDVFCDFVSWVRENLRGQRLVKITQLR